ncbi:hypothetical protein ACMFMG_009081 [Clarireedia jacksonii]
MSRITPPVTKFTHQLQSIRRISSSATAAHSNILDSQLRSSIYLPRKLSDLKEECGRRALQTTGSKSELISRLSAHDTIIRSQHTSSGRRPVPSTIKTIPLMQGFRTSAPRAAPHPTPTIDYFHFPSFPMPSSEPAPQLRVPLLPDNYSTTHSAPEVADAALPKAEINIVAANPGEVVSASALTEVVGNESLGEMDSGLGFMLEGMMKKGEEIVREVKERGEKEQGLFGELWTGIMEDVFSSEKRKVAV